MHILFGWIWIWKIDQGWHKLNAIKIRMQLFNSVGISIRVSKYTLKVLWNWIPFLCVCEHLNSGFSLNWCIQGNFISKTIYMTKPFDFLLLLCLKQKQGTQPKWQMRQTSNKTKTKFFHYTLETHTHNGRMSLLTRVYAFCQLFDSETFRCRCCLLLYSLVHKITEKRP